MEAPIGIEANLQRLGLFSPHALPAVRAASDRLLRKEDPDEINGKWALHLREHPNLQLIYVYGAGDGTHYRCMKEWLHRDPKHAIVFIEDDASALKALFATPIGNEIAHDRQAWVFFWDHDEQAPFFQEITSYFVLKSPYIITAIADYQNEKKAALADLTMQIHYHSKAKEAYALEFGSFGSHYHTHFFSNMLGVHRSLLGDRFFGRFKGVPAIICGAGPSLEKNAHLLTDAANKALIFAGGTALNALKALNINPHFGVGIDPNPEHVNRLIMNQWYELPFFYRNRINNNALRFIHGDRLLITGGGYPISDWLNNQLGIEAIPPIQEGNNVINFSLAIAHALGCNPIICVGVDLAYTNDKSYPDGIQIHALNDRTKEFRTKHFEEELITRNDIYGQPIITLWKWVMESLWYTQFAKKHPDLILLNATEGGIGFPDIPNVTLQEAISTLLKKEYDIDQMIHDALQSSPMPKEATGETVKMKGIAFVESLFQAAEIYSSVIKQIEEMEQNPHGEVPLDIKALFKEEKEQLKQLLAYPYLLETLDQVFDYVRKGDLYRYAIDGCHMTQADRRAFNLELLKHRYLFLKEGALVNGRRIRDVLDNTAIPMHFPEGKLPQENVIPEENGVRLFRYKSGALHSIIRKQNNNLHGLQHYFYQDGSVKSEIPYIQGKLHGQVKLYYPNGKVERELHFDQGKRHGSEQIWNEDGLLIVEAQYNQDKPIGTTRQWYDNGNLAKEIVYDEYSVVQSTRKWTRAGVPIYKRIAEKKDYFDDVNQQTQVLTNSLTLFTEKLNQVLPHLTGDDATLVKEMEELNREIDKLKGLHREMLVESGQDPNQHKEPIWKTPSAQKAAQEMTEQFAQEMNEGIDSIKASIETLLRRYLDKNS